MSFTNELIKMNPTRRKPKSGDIFVIQPKEGVFFYGRVIKTNLSNDDPIIRGWNLIYIYDCPTTQKVLPEVLNSNKLLISPIIVNNQGWLKGYFETIGNKEVTVDDLLKRYGFWDVLRKCFVDEEGRRLNFEPEIYADYGLGSYGVVGYKVQKALKERY